MNLIVSVLVAWAASTIIQGEVSQPIRITTAEYDGAIISADAQLRSDPRHLLSASQVWTPTEADVRDAEKLLPEFLNSRDPAPRLRGTRIRTELPHYNRQYCCVILGGIIYIMISFYHQDTAAVQKKLWLRGIVTVAGGGDQFFRITYHVQQRRFDTLQINAPE
jgi:hypothetical protein